jgi:hypothetical protein
MTRKSFVGLLAIAARRRAVAIALVYGLSLTFRFASAAGEKAEAPSPAAVMTRREAACESPMPKAVDAGLLLASLGTAPSFQALARPRSQEDCHQRGGGHARSSEKVQPQE